MGRKYQVNVYVQRTSLHGLKWCWRLKEGVVPKLEVEMRVGAPSLAGVDTRRLETCPTLPIMHNAAGTMF